MRAALEKLFYDKCAYCESKITVSEWNVEHFRPKGRVAERPGHPGYYWLTYDWDNLFPACALCNQRRKDKPRWGDLSYGKTGGKSDQFPLEDEETRAMSHNDDIYNEVALLIDPCYDDPEWYIEYGVLGNISSIENNPFGIAAINVCNLQRRRLRDLRREKINATADILKAIRKFESNGNKLAAKEIKKILEEHLLHDKCAYAGAARAVKNDPEAFGI